MGFDLHGRPPLEPQPLLALDDWPPCPLELDLHQDVWVGNTNLKTLFPILHSLSSNKGQKVEEAGVWEGSLRRWTLRWRRDKFEWESLMETDLAIHISWATVNREEQNVRVWGNNEKGCFSVKSAYECLAKNGGGPHLEVFKLL